MKYLSIIFILAFGPGLFAQAPDWSVNPNEFEYSMSFSGVVSIDTVENTNANSKIAAWVGGELRGMADPVYVAETGRYYYLLLVYANTVGETVEFTFYNADMDKIIDILQEETFVSDKNLGSFSEPYIFRNWENYLFNAFSFEGFDAEVKIDAATKQITTTLPENADPTSLVAIFRFDDAISVKVNGVEQESGVIANDFSSPVDYVVTTPTNTHTWTVKVTVEKNGEGEEEETITGIKDGGSGHQLMVYPNPVQNILNIDSSSKILEYKIFDNCGILILRGEMSNTIDVKDLPKGMYFIKITTGNDDTLVNRWLKY